MVVLENMPSSPAAIVLQVQDPAAQRQLVLKPQTSDSGQEANRTSEMQAVVPASVPAARVSLGTVSVALPARIPSQCINESANSYQVSPFVLLSILKVESNGQTGRIGKNTNGTFDIGPSQFNTNTWGKLLTQKYKIPQEALLNDMCQAVRALGFAVRTEINGAGGDLWRGIGNYHSRTPKHHQKYIRLVHEAYIQMTMKGKF